MTEFLIELTVDVDGAAVNIAHHDGLTPPVAELIASLIWAGLQAGEVQEIPAHRIEGALTELVALVDRDDRPTYGMLFALQLRAHLEADDVGSQASCAELARLYGQMIEGAPPPPKRGRPTGQSGGQWRPSGVRAGIARHVARRRDAETQPAAERRNQ
jgi:hypothetical protein